MDWSFVLRIVAVVVVGYLIGCISFAYISAKLFRGKDIRDVGSGNAGTANVIRNYGWGIGLVTFVGDAAKGAAAAFIGGLIVPELVTGAAPLVNFSMTDVHLGACICGMAAIIGHIWPVFLKFHGGKGVASSLGVFLIIMPVQAAIGFGICAVIIALTRLVSVGSLFGTMLMVASSVVFYTGNWWHHATCVVLLLLVWYSHRANIKRLAEGRENTI